MIKPFLFRLKIGLVCIQPTYYSHEISIIFMYNVDRSNEDFDVCQTRDLITDDHLAYQFFFL